jgi:hypothetical protein
MEDTIKEDIVDSKEENTFKMIREADENNANQSDEDTMKLFNYSSSDDDDNYSYVYKDSGNKVLKRRKARNQYSDITKEFQSEELKIKVALFYCIYILYASPI